MPNQNVREFGIFRVEKFLIPFFCIHHLDPFVSSFIHLCMDSEKTDVKMQ